MVMPAGDGLPSGYLERLDALCAIDTPSGHVEGLDRCAALLAGWAEDAGCDVEVVPNADGVHLVARVRGQGHGRTLLLGHHDTVYAVGTAAARPLRVEGGRVLGPGVADMKGGLLVGLAVLEDLARHPDGSHGTVELHCMPDEEVRIGPPATLDALRGADAAIVLECGRESGAIVSARKAGTWLTLRARGRSAHAGTEPHLGRSALAALAREVLRIEEEIDGARPGVSAVVTHLAAGSFKNVVPEHGEATVDMRADDAEDLRWAIERLGAFAAHDGVELEHSDDMGFPPMLRSAALVEATLERLRSAGQHAGEETAGGVSDGSWTSHVGVPTVDGLGPVGGRDHSPQEYIELASVGPRIAVVASLAEALGAGLLGGA
jgi:glutamate carboxypeptidase